MLQVGDGVKKWAVLLPTAVLPRPWRVAARREGLARLEVGKALRTDLLIIGHPKSGNTWLRVMMSRLYQVRHGIPASVIVTSDELARRNPAIPRISATNGHYSYEGAVGRLLASDAPNSPLRHKPIVLLARNPLRHRRLLVLPVHQAAVGAQAGADQRLHRSSDRPARHRHVGLRAPQRHRPADADRLPERLAAQPRGPRAWADGALRGPARAARGRLCARSRR